MFPFFRDSISARIPSGISHMCAYISYCSTSAYPIRLSISYLDIITHTTCIQWTSPFRTTVKLSGQDFHSKQDTGMWILVVLVIPYTRKFSPGENFHLLHHLHFLLVKFLLREYFVLWLYTLRIWRPLLHWRKFIPQNFLQYKGSWAWRKFCRIRY